MSTCFLARFVYGLWLGFSRVTGKISCMKVVEVGEKPNVCIVEEGVDEAEAFPSFVRPHGK